MRIRIAVSVLAAVAALGLAGCGSSDEDDVTTAIDDYNSAIATKDAKKACDLLSDQAKKQIGGSSCEKTVDQGLGLLSDKQIQGFEKGEVKNVKVDGDNATATVEFPKEVGIPPQPQQLVKQDDEWKLQSRSA
jgi:hypothetical protein